MSERGFDPAGRPYAKVSEVKEGTVLIPGGGFTCGIREGVPVTVQKHKCGLFIPCDEGLHALEGQLDEGAFYIGLYLAPAVADA